MYRKSGDNCSIEDIKMLANEKFPMFEKKEGNISKCCTKSKDDHFDDKADEEEM